MLTGTVIVSDLSGLGNRIFRSGESVTEDNFGEIRFSRLVLEGYIKSDDVPVEVADTVQKIEPDKLPDSESAPPTTTIDSLLDKSDFGNRRKRK